MSKKARVIYAIVSVLFLEIGYRYVSSKWGIPFDSNVIWFQAGALSFLLGIFFTEPHHTKPTDALLTSFSLFFTSSTIPYTSFQNWWLLFRFLCALIFFGAIFLYWVDKTEYESKPTLQKASRSTYIVIKELGSAKFLCTYAFVLGVLSFVVPEKQSVLLIGWIVLFVISSVRPHIILSRLVNMWKGGLDNKYLGYVSKFEEPNILNIEFSGLIRIHDVIGLCYNPVFENCVYGMVLDIFNGNKSNYAKLVILDNQEQKWNGQSHAFSLDAFPDKVYSSLVYENRDRIVGLVAPLSEIGKININVDQDKGLIENFDIVEVIVHGSKVLYQIVNAIVNEENVSKDVLGYKKAIAVQVGSWNNTKLCFDDYKWVPPLNALVYKTDRYVEANNYGKEVMLIGTFNTGHPILAKKADLVTHNTAILGVTGSGKSYFGYSLIEGILTSGVKLICIDNSGDYFREIRYPKKKIISSTSDIANFLNSEDHFSVATATNVNSVLNIVQQVYEWTRQQYNPDQIEIIPRMCVFIEEAHSAIPEWNSIVERDDQQKVNQISKFVMQGRKFGFGVIVVTQRTANVTKSILSQCNTIISFQAFDKTSNDFLSSFMGEDYINNIGRLETGSAVVAGKAIISGRPVVFEAAKRNVTSDITET